MNQAVKVLQSKLNARPKAANSTPSKRQRKSLSLNRAKPQLKPNVVTRSQSEKQPQAISNTSHSEELHFEKEQQPEKDANDDTEVKDENANDSNNDLNSNIDMELHGQYLMDLSAANATESIAQTERIPSPRVLGTAARRQELLQNLDKGRTYQSFNEKLNKTNEDLAPTPNKWLGKDQLLKRTASPLQEQFMRPGIKKPALSLSIMKNMPANEDKLRQTGLQLDATKDKAVSIRA